MKVKVISLPYIFQVLYVLCFTRPRYQVSVYRTIGPLVIKEWVIPLEILWTLKAKVHLLQGGRTGLMVRASDSGSGDPGSILGRVGVFVSLSKRHLLPKSTGN